MSREFSRSVPQEVGGSPSLSYGFGSRSRGKIVPILKEACPVCGESSKSGKCKTNSEDSEYIQCMTLAGTHKGATINGFYCLGDTKDGNWAQFRVARDKSDYTPVATPAPKQISEPKIQIQRIPIEQRDRFYQSRPKKLNQKRTHSLLDRGLTAEEIQWLIDRGRIWDCDRNGLHNKKSKGIGLSIVNIDGQITGAQIGLDDRSRVKYIYDSKNQKTRLPGSEESPFTYFEHPNCDRAQPVKLILCDGILKTNVAAVKYWRSGDYQTIFLGSPNGRFGATQLTEIFRVLEVVEVCYAADGGDCKNTHVSNSIESLGSQVKILGFDLKILWWGQFQKKRNPDIDELTGDEVIKQLTVEQFLNLNSNDRKFQKRQLRFNAFKAGLERDFLLSDSLKYDRVIEYKGFAPTLDLFADTTFLQGWLGSGKTETILRSLKTQYPDKTIVWVSPRNGLLKQTAQRAGEGTQDKPGYGFDTYHLQDDNSFHRQMLRFGESGVYFLCPDSLKDYAVGRVDWGNVILVIDEFSGIRKEVLGKAKELPQFLAAIENASSLIVADAFLSDADVTIVKRLRKGSTELVRQKPKKSPVSIKWLETRNQKEQTSFVHDGLYFDLLTQWKAEGVRRIAIATDTLNSARVIDQYLMGLGYETWLVCSETVEQNNKFLPNPDALIEDPDRAIEVVIYTPTAQSGLDIQTKFDRGLLISNAVIPPTQILQMLGRCRQCPEWWVSAPRRASNPDCLTPSLEGKKVKEWTERINANFEEFGFNTIDRGIQAWGLWERLTGDIEKAFNSEYLYWLLEQFFESVETVEVESTKTSEWREYSKIAKEIQCEETLKANLENGLRLLKGQKQPSKNSEVWDLKLAKFYTKYPKIAERAIEGVRGEKTRQDAIDFTKLMLGRQVARLRSWVLATDENREDDRNLISYLKAKPANYNSATYKQLQAIALFRELKLDDLPKCRDANTKKLSKKSEGYTVQSPEIQAAWVKFQTHTKLKQLFPVVEKISDLFGQIKWAMRSLGYKQLGGSHRVASDELHRNGTDRKGKQRFSKSTALYFVGWLLIDLSGNAFYREIFDEIIEAIRERMVVEREEKRSRAETESPPPELEAVAA